MKTRTPEELAEKWIRKMQKANFTPDQMLECLALARVKYEEIAYVKKRYQDLKNIFACIQVKVPPTIQGLIEAKKEYERLKFNQMVKDSAPSWRPGGIVNGNGFVDWLKTNNK